MHALSEIAVKDEPKEDINETMSHPLDVIDMNHLSKKESNPTA